MDIQIIEVTNRRHLKTFIYLPAEIHRTHKNWVPPIYIDDRNFFNPRRNRAFNYCDTILLLAMKGKKVTGRIMGIINHKYNKAHDERDARFCFMETYDEPMFIATNCNFPYQITLIENEGYIKHVDLVVYKLFTPGQIPDFYREIYERVIRNNSINLQNFKSRRELKPYIRPVLGLLNQTFRDIYAFIPMDEIEMDDYARRYLSILDPRFIKVVTNNKNEVIAFIIGMPDISQGIRSCKGHIFPFGLLKILYYQKITKQLNLMLGGIREDFQNIGIDAVLGVKMIEEAHRAGLKYIDSHLELEDNTKMRAEMELMNGKVYKKYRIYKKNLVNMQ